MKHIFNLVLLLLTLFFWKGFADSGKELLDLEQQLEEVLDLGDPKDEADALEEKINGVEGQRIFMGLLLTIASCVVGGVFAWAYVLLRVVHSFVQSLGNKVMLRFPVFALSSIVLIVMTVRALMAL